MGVLLIIVSISGCTTLNPEDLAFANPLVKQFMDDYPNAEIHITHFTAEQSEQILENISAQCGNPFITTKDYYRVTIDDPDSGLEVVAWIDWEKQEIECAVKYGTEEEKTISKPGEPIKECKAHHEYKCHGNHLYWYDSCGNKEEKKEACKHGCENATCQGKDSCEANAEFKCHGGHVFWYDSCGNLGYKKQACENGCENGACTQAQNQTNCTVQHEYKCYENHVYWYDSCGKKGDKKEYCNNGCEEGACIEANETENCTDSDGGKNYLEKGNATKGTSSLSDHCNGDGTLTEKYCEGNEIEAETVSCDEGYECDDGACVQVQNETNCTAHFKYECRDGDLYWLDSCGAKEDMKEDCGYGCESGACLESNCTEEGQLMVVYPGYECCEGLVAISSINVTVNGTCEDPLLGVSICSNCGDAVCDATWENLCNCPEDCAE
ncbi:MAG: hypothetical protein KKC05_01845 [Nanoarchaeota archaeon]|nr:hypothetical protein [Nanoarchaeota archaeon]